jgi:hypothetical protein
MALLGIVLVDDRSQRPTVPMLGGKARRQDRVPHELVEPLPVALVVEGLDEKVELVPVDVLPVLRWDPALFPAPYRVPFSGAAKFALDCDEILGAIVTKNDIGFRLLLYPAPTPRLHLIENGLDLRIHLARFGGVPPKKDRIRGFGRVSPLGNGEADGCIGPCLRRPEIVPGERVLAVFAPKAAELYPLYHELLTPEARLPCQNLVSRVDDDSRGRPVHRPDS